MLRTPRRDNLNRIVILNPKGGCGKSTLVTNIAACYAKRGPTPAIMDYDPQGSTMGWLERRPAELPAIHGIAAYKKSMQATRSWQLRVPNDTLNLIIDSPAGISHDALRELTRDASSILVPVLPCSMDIHAASRCIADLLLVAVGRGPRGGCLRPLVAEGEQERQAAGQAEPKAHYLQLTEHFRGRVVSSDQTSH